MHLVDTTMFWSAAGGGVRRYLLAKQAWLAGQAGWRHSLAVPGMAGASGVVALPSLPLPASGGYRLPLQRGALARRLHALQPDVIEAGDPYRLAWAALDAGQRGGVPALAFCHSNLAAMARMVVGPRFGRHAGAAAERAARAYLRHVYRGFDAVLAPSAAMCRQLEAWGVARVEQQALGVDTALFHPSRASEDWREAQGFTPDDRLLVYAGRLAPEKHLQTLADAVDRLGAPYTLLLIGQGPSPPQGRRLRRLPFVADATALATALASADAFLHAGDQETFGLSVLEAMACGTPVVARRSQGLAELVDERVGVAVESAPNGAGASVRRAADSAAFADAIAALFDRGTDLTTLGSAARERALSHGWDAVFPQMTARYRRLAGRPAIPPVSGGAAPLSRYGGLGGEHDTPPAADPAPWRSAA